MQQYTYFTAQPALNFLHQRNHHSPFLVLLSCLLLLLPNALLQAQTANKATISGYVSDAESGEKLIGATVFDRRTNLGTVTNTYGFFSLTLPKDSVLLTITYLGYEPSISRLLLKADQKVDIKLATEATIKEVVIKADRYERVEERAQMGRIDVPIEQIKRVPALLGEKDVLKALQLLPGVSGGGEGQSGLYVRGGGPDQNLILLDGVPVYNASHLFGFFSVFNTDAIKDVSLTKGGFPARYGGRLSSVIDISMKEGNENEYHGEGSIGIVASKLTLEGPIQKGKSAFIVSARRTYIDLLARPIIRAGFRADGSEGTTGYYFYDLNAKINQRINDKNRLYLSFYGGNDKFYLDLKENYDDGDYSKIDVGLGWGNITTALRWNHLFNQKLFANTTITYSRYNFNTKTAAEDVYGSPTEKETSAFSLDYLSGIDDVAGKIDFEYFPNPDHTVRFGANAIYHDFHPGKFETRIVETENNTDLKETRGEKDINATELAAYIEDDWKATDRIRINAGLHISAFAPSGKAYYSAQPRFNMRYMLDKGYALKASFATMRQYIHLLTNETIGLPTDLWLPTTNIVKPQDAWQTAIGAAKTLGKDYEFSIEAYYKEMKNVISFKEGSSFFQFDDWQTRVTQGNGEAYGLEFFVQKKTGQFSGWVGYTLSWANRQFADLNGGKTYPYKYDRRHDFEVVGSYEFNKRVRLSATWVYATGNAVTFGTSKYQAPSPYTDPYSSYVWTTTHITDRNNFRYPGYHRLDFGLDFTKKKKRWTRTWSFGGYNAYNRKNPFFLFLQTDYKIVNGQEVETSKLKQASLFPVIPYVNYSFKF